MEKLFAAGWGSRMDALPSPRLMATHMHHSLLPASIAANPDCCKIIYICRDPKWSLWHFGRRMQPSLSFLDVFEPACDGSGLTGPIWDHVLGYWNASKASPETVLDPPSQRIQLLLRVGILLFRLAFQSCTMILWNCIRQPYHAYCPVEFGL
jgi:hypothetical protein